MRGEHLRRCPQWNQPRGHARRSDYATNLVSRLPRGRAADLEAPGTFHHAPVMAKPHGVAGCPAAGEQQGPGRQAGEPRSRRLRGHGGPAHMPGGWLPAGTAGTAHRRPGLPGPAACQAPGQWHGTARAT